MWKPLLLALAFCSVLLVALTPAHNATAATLAPALKPTLNLPPLALPPPGQNLGVPLRDFPACADFANPWTGCPSSFFTDTAGGWSRVGGSPADASLLTFESYENPSKTPGDAVRPAFFRLGSPYITSKTGSLSLRVALTARVNSTGANTSIGAAVRFQARAYCQSTPFRAGPPTLLFPSALSGVQATTFRAIVPVATASRYAVAPETNNGNLFGTTQCPYVAAIDLTVVTYSVIGAERTILFRWNATREYVDPYVYGDNSTALEDRCLLPGNAAQLDCLPYQDVDPLNFEVVCSGAPVPQWLNFDWLPQWTGHYARCLFFPLGGWDSSGLFRDGLEASTFAGIYTAIDSAISSFNAAPSCGVVGGSSQVLGGFELNTCSWSSWASPVREALYWGIAAFTSIFAIRYAYTALAGLVNRRLPSPVEESAK